MITQLTDVIIPAVFMGYVIQYSTATSRLVQSGILETQPQFDEIANSEGRLIDMPFWNDLDGDDEVVPQNGALTPGKLSVGRDACTKMIRGKSWSYNDLVEHFTDEDPSAVISARVGDYKIRRQQEQLRAILTGIFASASMSANALDVYVTGGGGMPTDQNVLNGYTFIDGEQLMGEHKDKLTAIIMHSKVESDLRKQGLIESIQQEDGKPMIKYFQAKEVLIDDKITTEVIDGKVVYSSFLFGKGAIALGNGRMRKPVQGGHGTEETEFSRDALRGDSIVIFRWKNVMHPRGIRWMDANVADATPSNVELANPNNWNRVYDPKLIRIVRIRHNILLG